MRSSLSLSLFSESLSLFLRVNLYSVEQENDDRKQVSAFFCPHNFTFVVRREDLKVKISFSFFSFFCPLASFSPSEFFPYYTHHTTYNCTHHALFLGNIVSHRNESACCCFHRLPAKKDTRSYLLLYLHTYNDDACNLTTTYAASDVVIAV